MVTESTSDLRVFQDLESNVRYYCRRFPALFTRAKNALVYDEAGRSYIDFFSGAGALNYGHNNETVKRAIADYLLSDGITHALDMHTSAKRDFLQTFSRVILEPRGLGHKVQFCGPAGTDAVEAALKLARKATGRSLVVAFSGSFHGMTLGSLSVTSSGKARSAAGSSLPGSAFVPYPESQQGSFDSVAYLERLLEDPFSGVSVPAAVIVEPVQVEGGVYFAPKECLRELRAMTERHGILLIIDEIQSGCGRTGPYFAFEEAEIIPDIITVSKSVSGYGLPMALCLIRSGLDVWEPGEHSGTFRGHQLAFVAARSATQLWEGDDIQRSLRNGSAVLRDFAHHLARRIPECRIRQRGMLMGIDLAGCGGAARAAQAQASGFAAGLLFELCGRWDEVIKLMPPLTIEERTLQEGLDVLVSSLTR
jgi:diaminobutyrate-2-oxoglutarate transaminase